MLKLHLSFMCKCKRDDLAHAPACLNHIVGLVSKYLNSDEDGIAAANFNDDPLIRISVSGLVNELSLVHQALCAGWTMNGIT